MFSINKNNTLIPRNKHPPARYLEMFSILRKFCVIAFRSCCFEFGWLATLISLLGGEELLDCGRDGLEGVDGWGDGPSKSLMERVFKTVLFVDFLGGDESTDVEEVVSLKERAAKGPDGSGHEDERSESSSIVLDFETNDGIGNDSPVGARSNAAPAYADEVITKEVVVLRLRLLCWSFC